MMGQQEITLRHIKRRLIRQYNPERVILFGSRSRKRAAQYRDYDILIIKRSTKRPVERIREVSDIFADREFSLDAIVRTPAEIEQRLRESDPFYKEIPDSGRVLYAKRTAR